MEVTTEATSFKLTRTWSLLSLSLIVTDVGESTVIANGTPSSSALAYLFPMDATIHTHTHKHLSCLEMTFAASSNCWFCTSGKTVHLKGATRGEKRNTFSCSSPALLGLVLKQCS
ncbi:unnamed protein product [Arabidopsis halleri]